MKIEQVKVEQIELKKLNRKWHLFVNGTEWVPGVTDFNVYISLASGLEVYLDMDKLAP